MTPTTISMGFKGSFPPVEEAICEALQMRLLVSALYIEKVPPIVFSEKSPNVEIL